MFAAGDMVVHHGSSCRSQDDNVRPVKDKVRRPKGPYLGSVGEGSVGLVVRHREVQPPSMMRSEPVIYADSSVQRKSMAPR